MTWANHQPVIEVRNLTRQFHLRTTTRRLAKSASTTVTALDQMSFSIDAGEAVGYIGANGAGKSTTIKMLTGILVPTSGHVRTCGLNPVRHRRELARRIGVVFGQRSGLWWDLPLHESFTILAAIHRLPATTAHTRRGELIDQLELADILNTPVRQLSLGQRMRAELAAALLHHPQLVILDEPTIGLDVLSKQRFREFLRRERQTHGTTLLLTTHDMGDIQRLCDRVLLVDRGRLAYDGTLTGLATTANPRRVLVLDLPQPTSDLTGLATAEHLDSQAQGMRQRLAFNPQTTTAAEVLTEIGTYTDIQDLSIEEPDIEEVVRQLYETTR